MNINIKAGRREDRRTVLQTLWIFVLFNYLYCDVITNMEPGMLKQLMAGSIGSMQINQGFLLGAAILMEIPMVLILLSRVLNYPANRWVNVIAGTIMTLVQTASLFVGSLPALHYMFYSAIEISSTAFIVWYAWTWTNPEG